MLISRSAIPKPSMRCCSCYDVRKWKKFILKCLFLDCLFTDCLSSFSVIQCEDWKGLSMF